MDWSTLIVIGIGLSLFMLIMALSLCADSYEQIRSPAIGTWLYNGPDGDEYESYIFFSNGSGFYKTKDKPFVKLTWGKRTNFDYFANSVSDNWFYAFLVDIPLSVPIIFTIELNDPNLMYSNGMIFSKVEDIKC